MRSHTGALGALARRALGVETPPATGGGATKQPLGRFARVWLGPGHIAVIHEGQTRLKALLSVRAAAPGARTASHALVGTTQVMGADWTLKIFSLLGLPISVTGVCI